MDDAAQLVHQRLVLLYARASTCLEEVRTSGLPAHMMSVDGNPFPGERAWVRASYPIPVIDVKGQGSIGFDPAGAFFVFAVPTTEAPVARLDTLFVCFENAALLGAANLRDYRAGGADTATSVASAVRDGESVLLAILRVDLETGVLPALFRQAVQILRDPLVSEDSNSSSV